MLTKPTNRVRHRSKVRLLSSLLLTTSLLGCNNQDKVDITPTRPSPKLEQGTTNKATGVDFEDVVGVNNERYSITYTELTGERAYNANRGLGVEFVNKSTEKPLNFSLMDVTINNVQVPTFHVEVVDKGNCAESYIELLGSKTLKSQGITEYTDIEVTYVVYHANDLTEREFVSTHIYPYGEGKAERYVRESKAADRVLLDNEYVSIKVVTEDTCNLYVENKTDKDVYLQLDERIRDRGALTLLGIKLREQRGMFLATPLNTPNSGYPAKLFITVCDYTTGEMVVKEEVEV